MHHCAPWIFLINFFFFETEVTLHEEEPEIFERFVFPSSASMGGVG